MSSELGDELTTNVTDDFGFKFIGSIQLVDDYDEKLPYTALNNLALAPQKQIFAAAGPNGIIYGDIKSIRDQVNSGDLQYNGSKFDINDVNSVTFTKDEKFLIFSKSDTLNYINITNGLTSDNVSSFKTVQIPESINKIGSSYINPQSIAVLDTSSTLYILDLSTQQKSSIALDVTDFDWSPKGDKLIISQKTGSLKIINQDGSETAIITKPEDFEPEESYPVSVSWLLNDNYLITYGDELEYTEDEEPLYDLKTVLVTKDNDSNYSFHETYDIIVDSGSVWRHRQLYSSSFKNLSNSLPELNIIASSTAPDISPITELEFLSPGNDSERASLPMNQETSNDTTSIGLILDSRADNGPILEVSTSIPEADWLPIVWVLGSDGKLQGWYVFHVHDVKNGSFNKTGPVAYEDELFKLATNGTNNHSAATTTTATTETKPSAFSFGSTNDTTDPTAGLNKLNFGSTTESKPAFSFGSNNASSTTDTKPAFSFGSNSTSSTTESKPLTETEKKSAFGGSLFGSSGTDTKNLFGTSPFGSTTTSTEGKSLFGSTTTSDSKNVFGGSPFGSTTESKPTFGSSTFGSSTESKPTFGSSTFGSSTESKPTFGGSSFGSSTDSKPAFGSSAFGSTTESKPAFGSSTFGSSTESKPAFGSSAFGSNTESKPAFGSSGPTSFGQSTFGTNNTSSSTDAKTSSFGQSSFGNSSFGKSSFGQSSFGQSSFGSTTTTSSGAFGSKSAESSKPFGSSGGFGAFASNTESPFAAAANKNNTDSPFGKLSSNDNKDSSPFASFGKDTNEKKDASPFAAFGKDSSASSPFATATGNSNSNSVFGGSSNIKDSSPFASFGKDNSDKKTDSPFNLSGADTKNAFGSSSSWNQGGDQTVKSGLFGVDLSSSAFKGSSFGSQESSKVENEEVNDEDEDDEDDDEDEEDEDEDEDEDDEEEDDIDSLIDPSGLESLDVEDDVDQDESQLEDEDSIEYGEEQDDLFNENEENEEEEELESEFEQDDDEDEAAQLNKDAEEERIDPELGFTADHSESDNELEKEPELEDEDEDESIKIEEEEDEEAYVKQEPVEDTTPSSSVKVEDQSVAIPGEEETTKSDSIDEKDEQLYSEAKTLDPSGKNKDASVQSTRTGLDQSHSARTTVIDQAIVTEPDLIHQSHNFKPQYIDIDVQSFENEQVYQGEFLIPKSIKPYVTLSGVEYPKLSSDKVTNSIEKLIYDTEAELTIIKKNNDNVRDFINDQTNFEVEHGVESLNVGYQWRINEIQNLLKIVHDKAPEIKSLSNEIKDKNETLNTIKTQLKALDIQFKTIKEEVVIMELSKSQSKVANLRDLSFDAKILQSKIRKQTSINNEYLRKAEKDVLILKTALDTVINENKNGNDGSATSTALESLVDHLNTVSLNYARDSRVISEKIAKLNKNHDKILDTLKSKNGTLQASDNIFGSGKIFTQLKIDSTNRKFEKLKSIEQSIKYKTIDQLTSEF